MSAVSHLLSLICVQKEFQTEMAGHHKEATETPQLRHLPLNKSSYFQNTKLSPDNLVVTSLQMDVRHSRAKSSHYLLNKHTSQNTT